jgi:hypothetical protein
MDALLDDDGEGHSGVGGAQVGHPAQEAFARAHRLGACTSIAMYLLRMSHT